VVLSEDEVKRELGIESWRNLSKDKMLRFAAMMPDMDAEVALKIVEQFPVFKDFALNALKEIEKAYDAALESNDKSQDHVYEALSDIRGILKGELDKGDLTWDQRKYIIELIQENGRLVFQKDADGKRFLNSLFGKVTAVGVGVVALAVVFVGGKVLVDQGDGHEGIEA